LSRTIDSGDGGAHGPTRPASSESRATGPSRRPGLSLLGSLAVVAAVLVLSTGALPDGLTPLPIDEPLPVDAQHRSGELAPNALVALARASTLRVAARNCGMTVTGSGFMVGDVLVTNRHLVEDAGEAKVDQPARPIMVAVLRRAAGPDLAALGPVAAVPLELASSDASPGDQVVFAGHAAGGDTVVRRATVHLQADGSAYGMVGEVMLLDAESMAGFSGGPVLDGHGRLVGVLQGYEPNLRLTLAIPVSALDAWLEDPSQDDPAAPASRTAADATPAGAGMGCR
jgi:S1-C subfamily serine protease